MCSIVLRMLFNTLILLGALKSFPCVSNYHCYLMFCIFKIFSNNTTYFILLFCFLISFDIFWLFRCFSFERFFGTLYFFIFINFDRYFYLCEYYKTFDSNKIFFWFFLILFKRPPNLNRYFEIIQCFRYFNIFYTFRVFSKIYQSESQSQL